MVCKSHLLLMFLHQVLHLLLVRCLKPLCSLLNSHVMLLQESLHLLLPLPSLLLQVVPHIKELFLLLLSLFLPFLPPFSQL